MSRFIRASLASRHGAVVSTARKIFLVGGQSNSVGRGVIDNLIDTADARVEQWSKSAQQIVAASDPLLHPDPMTAGPGPGMFFAKAFVNARGGRVLLVPVGYGGTSLVAGTPGWALGGVQRENAITQANAAIAAAQAAYPGSVIAGALLIQGESDADASISQAVYQAAMWSWIQDMRDRITGASNMPVVIGQMLPEAITANVNYATGVGPVTYPAIDAAHTAMATRLFRCAKASIGTGYVKPETNVVHYNAAGGRAMGTAMYSALVTAEVATGEAAPGVVILSAVGSGANTQSISWSFPDTGEPMDYVIEYRQTGNLTWIVFSDGINTSQTITVTGLTPATSYEYRVRVRGYGGSGGYSNIVSASTVSDTTTVVRLTQIQPTATPKLTEGVNASSEWTYTIPAGTSTPTQATDRAGISSHKLPANTAGGFILEIGSPHFSNGTANYSSVMLGLYKVNTNTLAYNVAGASGAFWGVLHHTATGNTWRMHPGGTGSSIAATTPLIAAAGDRVKIERDAAGTFKVYIARVATPDTWTEYYTFTTTYLGDVFVSLAGSSAGTAPARTHGPVRGINVVPV